MLPALLTVITMVAFAANSVLCRMALGDISIDPYSFTAIRLAAGAATLLLVSGLRRRRRTATTAPSWWGAAFLVLYALPFSLAYVRIDTGTGALLLFGAVQLSMIGLGVQRGERPSALEWLGLAGAALGVVYLVSPGASAPDPVGAVLMIGAGVGWGLYSMAGKGAADPVFVTATNFRRAALVVVPATALVFATRSLSWTGVGYAAASGALASGLGYAIWYAALTHLSATRAALVQLSVPVLAAAGGVLFIAEPVTHRLALASVVILGSIALGVMGRRRPA